MSQFSLLLLFSLHLSGAVLLQIVLSVSLYVMVQRMDTGSEYEVGHGLEQEKTAALHQAL